MNYIRFSLCIVHTHWQQKFHLNETETERDEGKNVAIRPIQCLFGKKRRFALAEMWYQWQQDKQKYILRTSIKKNEQKMKIVLVIGTKESFAHFVRDTPSSSRSAIHIQVKLYTPIWFALSQASFIALLLKFSFIFAKSSNIHAICNRHSNRALAKFVL